MSRAALLLALALTFLVAEPAPAAADPLSLALTTFLGFLGSGTIAATLTQIGLGLGLSYLKQALTKKPREVPVGITGRLQSGGAVPRSFVAGRAAVEGSLVYGNTFGKVDGTPNAKIVQVIALSDLPSTGLAGLFVDGVEVTWDPETTPSTEGIAIPEFTEDDKEHLWVRFYDGSQTLADERLTDLFADDPDRPYTNRRKGVGITYAVVTSLINTELFSGFPRCRFVLDGSAFYDRRFDSTEDGDGDQRWNDPTTWEHTSNNVVIASNIVLGIRYAGEWLYGGQTVTLPQLPPDSLFAAANECDARIDLVGGGDEAQFEAGGEIAFDVEPAEAIEEVLKGANGKLAEIGGIYKFRVGAAGVAVFAFTDGDILSTEAQTFEPFPSLGAIINAVTGKFVSPEEGWNVKDAPPLYDSGLEDDDGGRRQAVDVTYGFVHSGTQVQRLMRSERDEQRAWRRHDLPMPPDAQVLEPLDVVSWTSPRNGYSEKSFDVVAAQDLPSLNVVLALKETDPTAYDWDPDTDEAPIVNAPPIVIVRPPSQAIVAFSATGILIANPAGMKRAGVRIEWDPDVEDVDGVQYEIRREDSGTVILADQTDFLEAGAIETSQNLLSLTLYEARARYRPASDRQTSWSGWLEFSTPDARISEADLNDAVAAYLDNIRRGLPTDLFQVKERLESLEGAFTNFVASTRASEGQINLGVGARFGENAASTELVELALADLNSSFAGIFGDVFAEGPNGVAQSLFQIIAAQGPEGALAAIEFLVRAGAGGQFVVAAFQMAALYSEELGLHSRIQFRAKAIDLIDEEGDARPLMAAVIAGVPNSAPIVGGTPSTVQANLENNVPVSKTLVDEDCQVQFPLDPRIGFPFYHEFLQDGTGGWEVSFDHSAITFPAPTVDDTPDVSTILQGLVTSLDPPRCTYAAFGTPGQTTTDSNTIFALSPAYGGNSVWNAAIQGPLTIIGPYTGTITPLGDDLQVTVALNGGGGGGGGAGAIQEDHGGDGDDTTFEGMTAGGGEGGLTRRLYDGQGEGPGGVASGGDTNTNGEDGNDSDVGSTTSLAPYGGASPNGGARSDQNVASSGQEVPGAPANAPGGGGGGAATGRRFNGPRSSGGGGGGGRSVTAYGPGVLLKNVAYPLVVGGGGTPGTADDGSNGVAANGAAGAPGRAVIS